MKTIFVAAVAISAASLLPANAWCVDGKLQDAEGTAAQLNAHVHKIQRCTIHFDEDCYDLPYEETAPPSMDAPEMKCVVFLSLLPETAKDGDEAEVARAMNRYIDAMSDFNIYAK